jgi:hypothetical protein
MSALLPFLTVCSTWIRYQKSFNRSMIKSIEVYFIPLTRPKNHTIAG